MVRMAPHRGGVARRGIATAKLRIELPRHGDARQFVEMQRRGYEVNCCAVAAYRSPLQRSGTEKHRQARQRLGMERLGSGIAWH